MKTKATVDLTIVGNVKIDNVIYHNGFVGAVSIYGSAESPMIHNVELPETELRKLPYGGVWTAQMQLKTIEWWNQPIGDVVTDIRLNVRSEASIFIPNSTVKLPVTMTGHSEPVTVDTCLFDGTGAGDSSRYELRLDDVSGAARGDLFALKNVT
ncbi:CfaE/CblD family pilus tip adhesin, partial [Yersinia enterocolitica]